MPARETKPVRVFGHRYYRHVYVSIISMVWGGGIKEEDWIKMCKCEYMNVLTWDRGYECDVCVCPHDE